MLMALSVLPYLKDRNNPDVNMSAAFREIQNFANTNAPEPADVMAYFNRYWMQRVHIYNFCTYGVPQKTNNDAEGLNHALDVIIDIAIIMDKNKLVSILVIRSWLEINWRKEEYKKKV